MEHIIAVELDEDLTAYVIGVEDLIVDRLNAYKYWKSLSDGEWAAAVLSIHFDDVDLPYLEARAAKEDVTEVLREILGRAGKLKTVKIKNN